MAKQTRYTTAEAADQLGISPNRVLSLAKSRGLGRRFGPVWEFSAAEVEAMRIRKPGKPRHANPSPGALYQREYRARIASKTAHKTS